MPDAQHGGSADYAVVHVVEDDPDLRDALDSLLSSVALPHHMYDSSAAFRQASPLAAGGCLVIDIRLPGVSGIDLAREIRRRGNELPLIMMSAHADVPVAIQSFKLGALDFLLKPFSSEQFLEVVRQALAKDAERQQSEARSTARRQRLNKLTRRDWEIIERLRLGQPNKRIAASLGISERAIEMRRAALLKKTQTSGLPELFELVALCRRDSLD